MLVLRPPRALPATCGAVLCILACSAGSGCGASPVNPDGCEKIEQARCKMAPVCLQNPKFDVAACKRFYRDQCLHGLGSAEDPGEPRIQQCVAAIEAAHACSSSGVTACAVGPATPSATPCDVFAHPEAISECNFLSPPAAVVPPEASTDAAVSNESSVDGPSVE